MIQGRFFNEAPFCFIGRVQMNTIPLLVLLAILAGIFLIIRYFFIKSTRGPAEKEGIQKGLLVALLTDSWLLGWLYAKKNSDYDYDERRLK